MLHESSSIVVVIVNTKESMLDPLDSLRSISSAALNIDLVRHKILVCALRPKEVLFPQHSGCW